MRSGRASEGVPACVRPRSLLLRAIARRPGDRTPRRRIPHARAGWRCPGMGRWSSPEAEDHRPLSRRRPGNATADGLSRCTRPCRCRTWPPKQPARMVYVPRGRPHPARRSPGAHVPFRRASSGFPSPHAGGSAPSRRRLQPLHREDHVLQGDVDAVRERVSRVTLLGCACDPGGCAAKALFQCLERRPRRARHLLIHSEDGGAESAVRLRHFDVGVPAARTLSHASTGPKIGEQTRGTNTSAWF